MVTFSVEVITSVPGVQAMMTRGTSFAGGKA
jgi:hypothetical protein